ncbi:hypothetical protein NDU88_001258 [Pleurodeles waltl]|uniref:Uncharacterized protein n=1 Tax=Pleurodeles waltl TaxID=8319 RepID=A0AAV7LCK9_PLEWA|nr:hypothetical protein NDU88_001258 [Pleurodeles waltl]
MPHVWSDSMTFAPLALDTSRTLAVEREKGLRQKEHRDKNTEYHIFEQQGRDSDDQDQSCECEGGEKHITAAQWGSEEEIGKGEDQGSRTRVGGSQSEANVQEETSSLDEAPEAWSQEWYTPPEDTGESPHLRRVAA